VPDAGKDPWVNYPLG